MAHHIDNIRLRRRALLGLGAALAAGLVPGLAPAGARRATFPKGFLWGAAVAGHQVEGDNVNSDIWHLEHTRPTQFKEPSGSAVDHYRLYPQDIAMLAALGLNTFRFSIEWARVEPVEGMFSSAALAHYRDVLTTCRKHKLRVMVSFNHFANPRWFAARGGWEAADAAELFARYCDKVTRTLGHLMDYALTFNEPNLARLLFGIPGPLQAIPASPQVKEMLANAGKSAGTGRFSAWLFGDFDKMEAGYLLGHELAYKAIKAARPALPVGLTIALADDQAVGQGAEAMVERKRAIAYLPWLGLARQHADYVGVQTYTRERIGPDGVLAPPKAPDGSGMQMEYYPQALEGALRYAARHVDKPLFVTENGYMTDDDSRRVAYIDVAVQGVANCLNDGIDVRAYLHWSLLDNFEWVFGYGPRFGLVAVDRTTMKRTVKPSARRLGRIARANGL